MRNTKLNQVLVSEAQPGRTYTNSERYSTILFGEPMFFVAREEQRAVFLTTRRIVYISAQRWLLNRLDDEDSETVGNQSTEFIALFSA